MNTSTIYNNLDNILNKFKSADNFLNSFNGGSNITTETSSTLTDNLESLNLSGGNSPINETDYLSKQINDLINMKKLLGGDNNTSDNNTSNNNTNENNTSENNIINNDLNNIDINQYGGKKNKSLYELNRKVDDLHAEALEKIKEVMNCSDDEAAVYKSVIYRKVKAEFPDLGGVDRAEKMKDYINKKFLKDVDLQAEIDKRIKEQEENNKNKKENNKSKKSSKKSKKSSKKSSKKEDIKNDIDI